MNTAEQEQALKDKSQAQIKDTTDPIELLRLKLLARGSSSIKALARVFRIMDDDRSRSLNFEEFAEGLKDYGVVITTEETKAVFAKFDKDASGQVSLDEFFEALRPPLSQSRLGIVKKAFQKVDVTGDGVFTAADLKAKMNVRDHPKYVNGDWTEQQCFEEFLKVFEGSDKDGKVTLAEFIDYYSGVSKSIDNDAYFDLMMRNAYKL